jgi:hypothetical protein
VFGILTAMAFARSGTGVLELVNQIGSAFYGPILAVFVLGVLTRGVTGAGAVAGLGAGLGLNLLLSRLVPELSWLWWNPAGFTAAGLVALVMSRRPVQWLRPVWRPREGAVLLGAFVVILVLLVLAPGLVGMIAGH